MHATITPAQLARSLAVRDLSDPAAGPHAMQGILTAVTGSLEAAWGCPLRIHRADPLVTIEENYTLLGYPADAPAREARYTRYVDEGRLLRSHASAMVPAALRAHAGADDDLVVACAGLAYRRDVVDRLHVGEPHQLDLWRVRRGRMLTPADLDEMVERVVAAVLPGAQYRALPATHPYTTAGLEVEVEAGAGWVELLECGLAGAHVLAAGGLDPNEWSGLALGMGLDRALMLRKGIDDIRLLRSGDPRVATQMLDLAAYRPVSAMPPVVRDLSVAVAEDVTAEELGDRVRSSLSGEALHAVEEVAVVAETPGDALPAQAIARIGLRPGQKNVLLRVVLRHPTRTLRAAEGNRIRDDVYAAVHEGDAHQWAGSERSGQTLRPRSDCS
jgi:phenylalanyl-tRNA synthetase alpha chain